MTKFKRGDEVMVVSERLSGNISNFSVWGLSIGDTGEVEHTYDKYEIPHYQVYINPLVGAVSLREDEITIPNCDKHNHVYSTKRQEWFCPFCNND